MQNITTEQSTWDAVLIEIAGNGDTHRECPLVR